jgi:hypothetical protein
MVTSMLIVFLCAFFFDVFTQTARKMARIANGTASIKETEDFFI